MESIGYGLDLMFKMVISLAIAAVVIVGAIAFLVGRGCAPTTESIKNQERRRAVIESLTQEQREALGIK